MSGFINLVGQKFGRLEVKEFVGRIKNRSAWNCLCDCGNTTRVSSSSLKSGGTKSCGCLMREQAAKRSIENTIHGQARKGLTSREYYSWRHMKNRCYNPKDKQYKDYGGRGIKVCDRWRKSFENFYKDMGDCPKGLTLDRKDNEGNYTPENCRWATKTEQNNNSRSNHWIEHEGERRTVTQWEKHLGIGIRSRLHRGWSDERALTTPVR